jgi:hypothetical protein
MESTWIVEIGDEFAADFHALHEEVQTEILALARVLEQFEPQFGRGSLTLVAEFPDQPPVVLSSLGEDDATPRRLTRTRERVHA